MNNDELEQRSFERWLANYVGVDPESLTAIRTGDLDEPYFHEDYDEDGLKMITIAWQAWLERSKEVS